MAATTSSDISNIFQFKVYLQRSKPRIWRRIEVPEDYTFWDLHVAIQDAMGWKDNHLHKFKIRNPITEVKEEIGVPASDDEFCETISEKTTKLAQYFLSPKDRASYEYDFGNVWEHQVTLEKILPVIAGTKYPQCTGGKMACPPEDCGGIDEYKNLLEILEDPGHFEHDERMEWYGRGFNSKIFNLKLVKFDDPKKRFKTASYYN